MDMNSGCEIDPGIRRRMFQSRETARYTIKEAAAELRMTRQRLSRCESGESSPTPEELLAMCILYGVTPSYVLMGANIHPVIGRAMRAASTASES